LNITVRYYNYEYDFPSKNVPEWSSLVERWYQVDTQSYGIASFYWDNKKNLNTPNLIMLASNCACYQSDLAFIKTLSPSKFVYTLPNVMSSTLCQVSKWNGPILCIQNGLDSFRTAILEAIIWNIKNNGCIWVFNSNQITDSKYSIELIEVKKEDITKDNLADKELLSYKNFYNLNYNEIKNLFTSTTNKKIILKMD